MPHLYGKNKLKNITSKKDVIFFCFFVTKSNLKSFINEGGNIC